MIDYSKFVEGSRNFLKNYLITNKLKSCIIGISGGIDSTISCAIASPVCKELGIPLIGRSLPTTSNKICETITAFNVGEAFCNDFKEVPIEDSFNVVLSNLVWKENEGHITPLQEGNIKARLRMMYLYNLASIHKGAVLDNDNFTEWNLGFWTLKGDEGDINLGLHYLWKTEIYELAEYLCEYYRIGYINSKNNPNDDVEVTADWFNKYEALRDSKQLIPTDGNGVSNSDCEQFGLDNYEQVDDVLKTMYYNKVIKDDYSDNSEYLRLIDSYNEQGVDKVMMLYQNTAYKREELPIKPTKEELGL